MPRKKKPDADTDPPTETTPPLAIQLDATATEPTEPVTTTPPGEPQGVPEAVPDTNGSATPPAQSGNGDKRKPVISWRLQSDRTTSIELAVWANTYRSQSGEEFEQLTLTLQRSFKTDAGWQRQEKPSWRNHDIPCLLFLLQKAHAYALDRRTTVTADCPF